MAVRQRSRRLLMASLVAAGSSFPVFALDHAAAAVIPVTTTADVVNAGDGVTSLREAVTEANASAGSDTIALAPGATYTLSLCDGAPGEEDANAAGDLDTTDAAGLAIEGIGATISQSCAPTDQERVLDGLSGVLTVRGSTLTGGGGSEAAALRAPALVLDQSTVTQNAPSDSNTNKCDDGAVVATGTVSASVISSTTAGTGLILGAGSTVTGSTIMGNSNTALDLCGGGGVNGTTGGVAGNGFLTIAGSLVSGNTGGRVGGVRARWGVSITGSIITENTGEIGAVEAAGQMADSVVSNNTSVSVARGGAIVGVGPFGPASLDVLRSTISGNTGGWVGAYAGTGTLRDSTVVGNTGNLVGGVLATDELGDLTIERTTITANDGAMGGLGVVDYGANSDTVTAVVHESTIVDNSGPTVLDNLFVNGVSSQFARLELRGSVIGGIGSVSCGATYGIVVSLGHNHDDDATCGLGAGPGDIAGGGDPMLGALADNGGPTQTRLPLPGSPLVNRVPPAAAGCAATNDQRGVARPQGPGCEIGAVESPSGSVGWGRSAGGAGSDPARAVRVDAAGATYVAGRYEGSATFGSGASTVTLLAQGPSDGFLVKYAADGTLAWARSIGAGGSDEAWDVAVDPSGNPVVVGRFTGTVSFGVGPLQTVSGVDDAFVAKYTSSGSILWVRASGGPDVDVAMGVDVASSGDVYVGGAFASAPATFQPGALPVANAGGLDGFVARYGANGGLWWVRTFAGPAHEVARSVAALPTAGVVVGGFFASAPMTMSGGTQLVATGPMDGFVATFSAGGAPGWARSVSGAAAEVVWSVDAGPGGEVYATGAVWGPAIVGAGGPALVPAGASDGFVARFEPSGGTDWAAGFSGPGADLGIGVHVHPAGVFVAGSFTGSATFGPSTITGGVAVPNGALARLTSGGTWEWAQTMGTGPAAATAMSVSSGPSGTLSVGGFFQGTASFGAGADAVTLGPAMNDDVFVVTIAP